MKVFSRLLLSCFLFSVTAVALASAGANQGDQGATTQSNEELPAFLLNLGGYLGYDLKTNVTELKVAPATEITRTFLNLPPMQVIANYLFNTYAGALLVNTAAPQEGTQFGPSNLPVLTAINAFANYTFTTTPPFNTPSNEQVSVSQEVDQPPYQADPVSQIIKNILVTPDGSYCLNPEGTALLDNCPYLDANQMMIRAVGDLPGPEEFFSSKYIQPFLSELNSNSLLSPLLYNTSPIATPPPSRGQQTTNEGLRARSQAQQAANFIRYVLGTMAPLRLPNRNEYEQVYIKAKNQTGLSQRQAQAILAAYFTNLRSYIAQNSVAMGNLYSMLSKRLPQSQGTSGAAQQQNSQALSEFTMATRRLFNPDQSENTQWLTQINQASAATIQKEMVALLAEINYQLYLSRQQQERILLTNTMLLIQHARSNPPLPTLG
jgi:intracellular multiplication protein IcmX